MILEENVCLPSNGKVYTKVINWVQRSVWENGKNLEDLMEEVSTTEVLFMVICRLIPITAWFFVKLILKNLNFTVGAPKLRKWGCGR